MADVDSDNLHDTTDDALETILMEEEAASQDTVTTSNDSVVRNVATTPKTVFSLPQTKVVIANHSTSILATDKSGNPVTRFVLKKAVTPIASVPLNTFTVSPVGDNKAKSNVQTVTLQRNNLTLSPVKGGFKIPLSPMKNPLRVAVLPPTNTGTVKNFNLAPADKSKFIQLQTHSNFQFQTLATTQNNRINVNNTPQAIPQNLNIQQEMSGGKLQCLRLLPSGGDDRSVIPGNLAVANLIPARGTASGIAVGTPFSQPPQNIQAVVNMQAVPKPTPPVKTQRLIMPATTIVRQTQPTISSFSAGPLLQTGGVGYAMVPAKYVEQLKKQLNTQCFTNTEAPTSSNTESSAPSFQSISKVPMNGKVRKPCNCTKSMCLKLYCECFANGHFCDECNCINCHNNLEYEGERSKAIRSCLERNPMAFRPKIGRGCDDNRTHQKGCNCKRSGCLKNYCECYEARIPCTSRCKCIGCKNVEDNSAMNMEQRSLMNLADAAAVRCQQQDAARSRINSQIREIRSVRPTKSRSARSANGDRLPSAFFTQEVIEATCTCMLAQAEEAEKTHRSPQVAEMMILEEFGRCLMQIIQTAGKTKSQHH